MNFSEPLPVASDNVDLKTNPEPEIRLELDSKRSCVIFESYVTLIYVRMALFNSTYLMFSGINSRSIYLLNL